MAQLHFIGGKYDSPSGEEKHASWKSVLDIPSEPSGGGGGAKICFLSTGIPDLEIVKSGANVGVSEQASDIVGHSYAVAGVVEKLIPESDVAFCKVTDDHGAVDQDSLAAGILWSTVTGCQVVVISHKIENCSTQLSRAIDRAASKGMITIVPKGFDETVESKGLINLSNFPCSKSGKIASKGKSGKIALDAELVAPAAVGALSVMAVSALKSKKERVTATKLTELVTDLISG